MANGHGGRRKDAGRPPELTKHIGPESAARLLGELNYEEELKQEFHKRKPSVHKLQILFKLLEYAASKPAQAKEQPKEGIEGQTRVIVNFWDDGAGETKQPENISKPASEGPKSSNVTVHNFDTHMGPSESNRESKGPLGSSLGPSDKVN